MSPHPYHNLDLPLTLAMSPDPDTSHIPASGFSVGWKAFSTHNCLWHQERGSASCSFCSFCSPPSTTSPGAAASEHPALPWSRGPSLPPGQAPAPHHLRGLALGGSQSAGGGGGAGGKEGEAQGVLPTGEVAVGVRVGAAPTLDTVCNPSTCPWNRPQQR